MGQVIISKQINHTEGSPTEAIQPDKHLANGIYQLEVTQPDRTTIHINVALLTPAEFLKSYRAYTF